jgi:hypothetical protein
MLKRTLSLLLIATLLLTMNITSAHAAPIGHTDDSTEAVDKKQMTKADSPDSDRRDENGESGGSICGFKYLVYFLWFSFAIVFGCVVIVMDLATGFTQDFTIDYIEWSKGVTEALNSFFDKIGCGNY